MINESELDIDIVKIFITLWKQRWKVIIITTLSLFIGVSYSIYNKPKFETKIELRLIHVFESDINKIDKLFYDSFYSLDLFSNWKKLSDDKILKFESINNTINQNGFSIRKSISDNLIVINSINVDNKASIVIKTNELDLIKSIYNYLEFVNSFITNAYRDELLSNLEIVFDLYRGDTQNQSFLEKEILDIKKLVKNIDNDQLVISIGLPNTPVLVSKPTNSILFISIIIGFLFSLFFIFFLIFIENIKHDLNKK